MQLKTKLLQLNQNEPVSIGAQSGFFFIGYPKEFLEQEEEINKQWQTFFAQCLNSATAAYENCLAAPPEPNKEVKRRQVDFAINRMTDAVIPYEVLYKEWEEKCAALQVSKFKALKRYDKFKPFGKRDVKECYRNLDNNANIVIIRGYESGRYWTKQEYDRDKQKGLNNGKQSTNETQNSKASRNESTNDTKETCQTEET